MRLRSARHWYRVESVVCVCVLCVCGVCGVCVCVLCVCVCCVCVCVVCVVSGSVCVCGEWRVESVWRVCGGECGGGGGGWWWWCIQWSAVVSAVECSGVVWSAVVVVVV